jgi:hypothetical protein
MKHVFTLSFWGLVLITAVISCKKDDPAAASNPLIGSWLFVSVTATGCTDPLDNFVETCTTDCGTLAITATGWTFTQPGTSTDTGTYTINGTTVVLSETGGSTDDYTFTIVGSTLTFTKAPGGDGCVETSTYTKL